MKNSPFFRQADLLVQLIPFVHAETSFALKGGTAINFFVRSFPRLSVDIDLVYIPVEDRETTLQGIDAALRRVAEKIRRSMPTSQVMERRLATTNSAVKLLVRVPNIPRSRTGSSSLRCSRQGSHASPSTSVIFSRAVNKKLEMPVNTG